MTDRTEIDRVPPEERETLPGWRLVAMLTAVAVFVAVGCLTNAGVL